MGRESVGRVGGGDGIREIMIPGQKDGQSLAGRRGGKAFSTLENDPPSPSPRPRRNTESFHGTRLESLVHANST